MNTMTDETPADRLEGCTLASGWVVGARISARPGATGANFGVSYIASREGKRAFLKALDFRRAFRVPDFLSAVRHLADCALWEKEVLEYCTRQGLSKVIQLHDYEEILLPGDEADPTKRVSCFLMEIGEGDLRGALVPGLRASWKLFVLRDVALALDQLHRRGIAHLDVKPSNVIAVAPSLEQPEMKLGDLGRVIRKGVTGPFDTQPWPGDPNYRPPEKWYGLTSKQWNDEREAADAYLLGSMLVFLFTGLPMPTLLYTEIPPPFKPENYRAAYNSDLIDVLVAAQSRALGVHLAPAVPPTMRDELITIALELTHPDPCQRGDSRARRQGLVGIDRYHQKFLRLARQCQIVERSRS